MITSLAYVPFFDPLPIWVKPWFWPLLLLPLCLAVAVVYKCVRCSRPSQVPREATVLFVTIVVGMILTAAALAGLAAIMG
ncbi:MAG: hypothetical protein ABSD28_17315 [Tepidisphaeraceae bacterium]|jgi:hypothetical protein